MSDKDLFDYIFKFILIGNGNSGKTSLLYYFINSKEKKSPTQTIGVEFSSKLVSVSGKSIKLQLWDTAGQERYRSITKTYYRGALGAIIPFDITNYESYEALEQWVKDAKEQSRPDIQIIVVGNKSDLADERVVSTNQAQSFCQERGLLYIETSALNGTNVDEAFLTLTKTTLTSVNDGKISGDSIKPRFYSSAQKLQNKVNDQKGCSC